MIKYRKIILVTICVILGIIPFFWLHPGEMDLGGDSTRLYFYDPLNYFKNAALYGITPVAIIDNNAPNYLIIPFNLVLILLKQLFQSSYFIISVFHSLHLLIGFICVYSIIRILLLGVANEQKKLSTIELASIFSGICYVFLPTLVFTNWNRADIAHSYFFINPLMFFLLLKYGLSRNVFYLFAALLTSFIFAFNFGWFAAPYIVSFYLYTFAFLLIYIVFIRKIHVNVKELIVAGIGFLILHTFHLLPFFTALFFEGGNAQTRTFSETAKNGGLIFFRSISSGVQLVPNLLGVPQWLDVPFSPQLPLFVLPFVLIIGLVLSNRPKLFNKERSFTFLVLLSLFLICLFFVTAKITNLGLSFYESLFRIPSFSMFRSFYQKWVTVYSFSFTLALGYASFYIFEAIENRRVRWVVFSSLLLLIVFVSFPFIRGDVVRAPLYPQYAEQTKAPIKMDPDYEKMLEYIREDLKLGRFFSIPYTDFYTPMISGTDGGIYYGPSMISFLTGHADINGQFTLFPFSLKFYDLLEKKDYKSIENLFSLLNIRYVYYNSDEAIVKNFPDWPYRDKIRTLFSPDPETMAGFLGRLPITKKMDFGKYHIYEMDKNSYLPIIYVAKKTDFSLEQHDFEYFDGGWVINSIFYQDKPDYERRTTFLLKETEQVFSNVKPSEKTPAISFNKVNPTRYIVSVQNATDAYLLTFLEPFNAQWKVFLSSEQLKEPVIDSYFNNEIQETKPLNIWLNSRTFETWNKKSIAEENHMRANGYANAWYITPADAENKSDYTLIIEYSPQRIFYIGVTISLIGIVSCVGWLGVLLWKQRNKLLQFVGRRKR